MAMAVRHLTAHGQFAAAGNLSLTAAAIKAVEPTGPKKREGDTTGTAAEEESALSPRTDFKMFAQGLSAQGLSKVSTWVPYHS